MKRVFLAEKPSLGRAIASVLGNGKKEDGYIQIGNDVVTWCFGHILQQCDPEEYDEKYRSWKLEDLPIIPKQWKMKVAKDASKQFNIIKKLCKEADVIVNAGDPDREGQLLVDEVLNYIGLLNQKKVQRILLNALDEKSVREALNNLRENKEFVGLRNSALARSRADWVIGMNLSRVATIKARNAGYPVKVVSVGRVMTPTTALVIRREDEIKNFKQTDYFQLNVIWKHQNGEIISVWQPKKTEEGFDNEGRLLKKEIAEKIAEKIKGHNGKILSVEEKEGQSKQHLPYSLSTLQIEAGKIFGYSPKEVLDTQQSLYEKQLTSYPRSDCNYLPENQIADAEKILENLKSFSDEFSGMVGGADLKIKSSAWNDKKISAHHAIIPTTVRANYNDLTEKEKNLYKLVAKAYIAQFYPVEKFLSTKIKIDCEGEKFQATGKVVLENGWKALYKEVKNSDEEEIEINLPKVSKDDTVFFQSENIASKKTHPPKRFTPASLIEAMKKIHQFVKDESLKPILKECSGIGTEATRAEMIEKIQRNDYVKLEKKFLVPTETGRMMLSFLSDSLTYPDITARWEKNLEAISNREMKLEDFFQQEEGFIKKLVEEQKEKNIVPPKDLPKCPKCDKPLKKIRSKKNQKFYWICEDKNCQVIFSDKNGKPDFNSTKKRSN
ncbi:MAG: DNA topoisomerase III [Selenomonadaceae bacterium]|nr:DNA topoisomerase III [Selenomonadaceae bacterium]